MGATTSNETPTRGNPPSLMIVYALLWAAASRQRTSGPALVGVGTATRAAWRRLSNLGPEVGVFCAACWPCCPRTICKPRCLALDLGPVSLALGLSLLIVVQGLIGFNPIVTASVFGAIASQLAAPGLSDTAIALAITGGWAAVIGLSPFITTLVIAATIMGRSTSRIGLAWNGVNCLVVLTGWMVFLAALVLGGLV